MSGTERNGLQATKTIDFMLLLTMEPCSSLVEGVKVLVQAPTKLKLYSCL